ncbi:hypothetical protein JW905_17630 [bacterium]|nr:hypothetical protein [candidate division CSSED10-310 bacterium]
MRHLVMVVVSLVLSGGLTCRAFFMADLGPRNARRGGFAGAGVAVVPIGGLADLNYNPASIAMAGNYQIKLVGGYITDIDVGYIGAELFAPLRNFALSFDMGAEFGDEDQAWDLGFGGAVRPLPVQLALGMDISVYYVKHDGDDGGNSVGPEFVPEFGVLYRSKSGFNLGARFNMEDEDVGVPSSFSIGAAYQPSKSPFLFGVEYEDVDIAEESVFYGYGEFKILESPIALRAGIGFPDEGDDILFGVGVSFMYPGTSVDLFVTKLNDQDPIMIGAGFSF